MSKGSPVKFLKEVRGEGRKITWPTKDETIKSTIAVFIMVTVIALFLLAADWIMGGVIRWLLGL